MAGRKLIKNIIVLLLTMALSACADLGISSPKNEKKPAKKSSKTKLVQVDSRKKKTSKTSKSKKAPQPAKQSTKSCAGQQFNKYKKRALKSINRGWAATQTDKYGIGFKDAAEHGRWQAMHRYVFKHVAAACDSVQGCRTKGKNKKCKRLQKNFNKWQQTAKLFAKKVKQVEVTHLPALCTLKPTLADPSRCYQERAEHIGKACGSSPCKDLSSCWRDLASTDEGMRQAESSCGYHFSDINDCYAYRAITQRRKQLFEQCSAMDQKLKVKLQPVL